MKHLPRTCPSAPQSHIRWLALAMLCLTACAAAYAQKRAITAKDFDSWKNINGQVLSHDGHYLAYGLFPQEGDGEVVIRDLKMGTEVHEAAGEMPPPPPDDPAAEAPPPPRAIKLVFSEDSKTLVFLAYASHAAVEKAKAEKKTPPATAHEELVITDLATSKQTRVSDVKSFQLPEKGNGYVAYLKYGLPDVHPAAAGAEPASSDEQADQRAARPAGSATPTAQFGAPLVLRSLVDSTENSVPDVLEFAFAKDSKLLAYSVASPKADTDGVFMMKPGEREPRALWTGKGRYEHLTFDEAASQLAFVGNPSTEATPESPDKKPNEKKAPYALYLWLAGSPQAGLVVSTGTPGFHAGYIINDHATLTFSKDGKRLFFGAAPVAPPAHATAIDQDKPSFDLWRYQDDYIQPAQKVRATQDLNRSYRAVYLTHAHKMIQLADESMPELLTNESGRYALGTDDRAYRSSIDYAAGRTADYYIVDTDTGARTAISKKFEGTIRWSGNGRYILTFDGKDWSTIEVPSGKVVNLTAKLAVKFFDEEDDHPAAPGPYGLAGWTKDDKFVLLYDHYDVWQMTPDGSQSTNLTFGVGRREHLQFRYAKLDPDPEIHFIDAADPLTLRAEDLVNRDSGFYVTRVSATSAPTKLVMMAKDFSNPIKARNADVMLTSTQTFSEYPNLLVTNSSFVNPQRVTDANPQQSQFLWGTDELISYESLDGVPLQGILYKPANFDPKKKYPMITYFYEKLSETVNHFVDPRPMDSINISYYVSNGYLVFVPDIVYTVGYPGQSALKCVLAGVNKVASMGFLDEKNIGVQGHSWGGYQIAYLVTQTNRFKAAEDGAPVVNMISAYDGIRWGPGRPRQFQYEATQSRIGGTPWAYPMRYIENSPIFMVDRIHTPLLIIHNDADDAVPWYQGIEFFLALRRLNKEAYMFTYNGEPHHLRRRANQKDYAARMAQYFDYELKGAAKPAWMEKGIPYLHTPEQMAIEDQP